MSHEEHPSRQDLIDFANGELDDKYFEQVASHVELCKECEEVLREPAIFARPLAGTNDSNIPVGGKEASGDSPTANPS